MSNSEHIDAERVKGNIYWDCYQGYCLPGMEDNRKYTFSEIEKEFYYENYHKFVEGQNRRNMETNGKFAKNDKLSFITDDMLIVGCDIGSETHYIRIRNINRLHRELKIYFPEYMDAFGKIDGAFTLEVLKVSAIPSHFTALGAEGVKNIWHNAKLRGRGYSRANEIVSYAEKSVGLTNGTDAGREAVKWYAEQILKLDEQLAEIESALHEKCREIPYAENILEINGVGENILAVSGSKVSSVALESAGFDRRRDKKGRYIKGLRLKADFMEEE